MITWEEMLAITQTQLCLGMLCPNCESGNIELLFFKDTVLFRRCLKCGFEVVRD